MKKTTNPKGLLAYKVFDRIVEAPIKHLTTTCGHPGCTAHTKVDQSPEKVTLSGPYSNDKTLQKAGDKGTIPSSKSLSSCATGWHAFRPIRLQYWISSEQWRKKQRVLWLVRLSGEILEDGSKLVGRNIEMIREIPWGSEEAKHLQGAQAREEKRRKLREKKRAEARRKMWALREKRARERRHKAAEIAKKRRAALAIVKRDYYRKIAAVVASFKRKR